MKKYLLSAVLGSTILAGASQAGCHDLSKAHHGFYVGANAGYATGSSNLKRTEIAGTARFSAKQSLSQRGAIGGLNLGYQHHFKGINLVAGLDLKGTFSGLNGKSSENIGPFTESTYKLKMNNSLGAALRVGVLWHNVMPYLKAGYVSSTWKADSYIPASLVNRRAKKHLNGAELGVGVDIPMTEALTVGGEYSFETYENMKLLHRTATGTAIKEYKVKPQTNQFVFRVKYKLSGLGF